MDFYILAKSIAYLFLSLNAPTTLVFQEPIEYVSAGKTGDFSLNRSNNQRILVIQPLKEIPETNMVVITKDQHFQFRLKTVDKGHHAFVYVYRGTVRIGGEALPAQRMAILANQAEADGVVIEADSEARALLIAGRPLNEEIAQYGPFVMNTEQEIYQALNDFRDGRLA